MAGYGTNKTPGRGGKFLTWVLVGGVLALAAWRLTVVSRTILADVRRHGSPPLPVGESAVGSTAPANLGLNQPSLARTGGELVKDSELSGTGGKRTGTPGNGGEEVDPTTAGGAETEPAVPTTQAIVERTKQIDLLIAGAADALDSGDLVLHRKNLNDALALLGQDDRAADLRSELAAANVGVFLGPDLLAGDDYAFMDTVATGDTYQRLARKYAITSELLAVLNPGLNSRNLKPETGIKIVFGPFHVRILKEAGRADLFVRNMYVRSYAAAFDPGNDFPAGLYRVRRNGKLEARVALEGVDPVTREAEATCLYGPVPARAGASARPYNGARFGDSDLRQLYNVLVEQDSYVRVDP